MPTYTKIYTFAAGENWADELLSTNMVFAVTAADGNPQPSGEFSGAVLLGMDSDTERALAGQTTDTFESVFGVVHGETVTGIQCSSDDYKYAGATAQLGLGATATLKVRARNNAGTNLCIQDLLSLSLPTTAGGWTTNTSGTNISTTGNLASDSQFRLEIENPLSKDGVGHWTNPQYFFDNITIVITTTPASGPPIEDPVGYRGISSFIPTPDRAVHVVQLPYGDWEKQDFPPLKGQMDEDFRLLVPPWPETAKNYIQLPYEPEPEELPAGNLRGQDDEDFDPREFAMPMAVPATMFLRQPYLYEPEESMETPSPFGPEEEFWRNWVPPVPAKVYQSLPIYGLRDLGDLAPGVIPLGPAVILKAAVSVQQANLWCIARVAATKPFNLNLLTANIDLSASYVVKQVVAAPLAGVDGATAGYIYQAEMSVPWPCIGQLQIYGATGIAYDADVRFYYKMRHRRR